MDQQHVNSPKFAVAATTFDRVARKLAKAKAKLRKELRALRKKAKAYATNASEEASREEVRVEEARDTKKLQEQEMIEKATTDFCKELQIEEDDHWPRG